MSNSLFAQKSIDKTLEKFNKKSIPYITVEELKASEDVILLDAREKKEFEVSHIQNAIFVGYKNFDITAVPTMDKNQKIIVYCSIGVRSEDIGEKLVAQGYTNVQNLYGGIFKWMDHENPVFDNHNNLTKKVHGFDKFWSKLVTKGEKILN